MLERIKTYLCRLLGCPCCAGPVITGKITFSKATEITVIKQSQPINLPAYNAADVKRRTLEINVDGSDLPTVELDEGVLVHNVIGDDGETVTVKMTYYDKKGNPSPNPLTGTGTIDDTTGPVVEGQISFGAATEVDVPDEV